MSKVLVFVGGFAAPGNEWPLTPIRRSAREQGWRTKYFDERLAFGPLATSAERLVKLIDKLDQAHDTIVVIGHSMGGLGRRARRSAGSTDRRTRNYRHTAPGPQSVTLRPITGHEGDGDEQRLSKGCGSYPWRAPSNPCSDSGE